MNSEITKTIEKHYDMPDGRVLDATGWSHDDAVPYGDTPGALLFTGYEGGHALEMTEMMTWHVERALGMDDGEQRLALDSELWEWSEEEDDLPVVETVQPTDAMYRALMDIIREAVGPAYMVEDLASEGTFLEIEFQYTGDVQNFEALWDVYWHAYATMVNITDPGTFDCKYLFDAAADRVKKGH